MWIWQAFCRIVHKTLERWKNYEAFYFYVNYIILFNILIIYYILTILSSIFSCLSTACMDYFEVFWKHLEGSLVASQLFPRWLNLSKKKEKSTFDKGWRKYKYHMRHFVREFSGELFVIDKFQSWNTIEAPSSQRTSFTKLTSFWALSIMTLDDQD